MGIFTPLYNMFYRLNPFGTDVRFQAEITEELPALPDLSQHFTPYSPFGTLKFNIDPRFPWNNIDRTKACYTNFCVWRECLRVHSETLDEEDPNARICKRYKSLAMRTCPLDQFNKYQEAAENDSLFMMLGLNKRIRGKNATVLHVDNTHTILKVVNQNENAYRYKPGQHVHLHRGQPGWDLDLEREYLARKGKTLDEVH